MNEQIMFVNPLNAGLTSSSDQANLKEVNPTDLPNILSSIGQLSSQDLDRHACSGEIVLNAIYLEPNLGKIEHTISKDWCVVSERYRKDLFIFRLSPLTLKATNAYKKGLDVIAEPFIKDKTDRELWVRYDYFTKIFYLKEFSEVIKSDSLIEAVKVYSSLFTKQEYLRWVKEFKWPFPTLTYILRKYLKFHVERHLFKKNIISKT